MTDTGKFVEKIRPHEEGFLKSGGNRIGRIDIELTERCDNNCIHCSINIPENSTRQSEELTTSEWKRIIREAADLGVLRIRFTGGEPLLRDDFIELYSFTRKLGIKVIIFTNARKITETIARMLSDIPPLEKMEVSVYGMSRESYEKVSRIPGSYNEFRAGVDLLIRHRIPFIVKGIILPDNLQDREDFERWAVTLPWMKQKPSYSSGFELRERRDSGAKNRLIRTLRRDPDERDPERETRGPTIEFLKKFSGPPGSALFSCGAGESGSIDPYGMIHPCLTLKADEFAYDLRKGTIADAVFNYFPKILDVKTSNPDYLRKCSNCFLKGLCLQCPSRSWSETGTFDTPVEFLCRVTHAKARKLGLLKENENSWEISDWKERIHKLEENGNDSDR